MADDLVLQGIREFVSREVAPRAGQVDRSGELPGDLWRTMGQQGLLGLLIPPQWGGVGADFSTFVSAVEILGAACASTTWAYLAHCAAVAAILSTGSDAQRDRYLPALAEGRMIGSAMAGTETGGGSNHLAMRTFAQADGHGYVLNGSKFFISQAGIADLYVVMARTDQARTPRALSCFLVEKGDAGLSFGKREETMGLHGVQVGEVNLQDCRLSAERLLGAVGGGMAALGAVGGVGGFGAMAATIGMAQAALDATVNHVKSRTVLDQPLSALPGVQTLVVDLSMELAGARAWLGAALAWRNGQPKGPPVPVWMGKVAVTEAAARIIDRCMALHGAVGYSRALGLERVARDARAFCYHWGNNEVMKDNIAKAILAN